MGRNDGPATRADIERLEGAITELQGSVKDIRDDLRSTNARVGSLESDSGTLKAEMSTMKADMTEMKADMKTVKADIGSIRAEMVAMESRLIRYIGEAVSHATSVMVEHFTNLFRAGVDQGQAVADRVGVLERRMDEHVADPGAHGRRSRRR